MIFLVIKKKKNVVANDLSHESLVIGETWHSGPAEMLLELSFETLVGEMPGLVQHGLTSGLIFLEGSFIYDRCLI